jgi:hypothetical protein
MHVKFPAVTALVASAIAAAAIVQSLSSASAQTQTRPRYLPEYTALWRSDPAEGFPRMGLPGIAAHS